MEPNKTTTITNRSTEEFEVIQMGFDQSAIVHLMDVLTNLYSDSALAVIREYSTNARDSHLAAGNTDPIEVFLPGPFNSNFRVVDKGVGLSTDEVHSIYSKYGRSTKRGNNLETGMLGLGCKSGLAFTKQFKLKAVKNGVRTLATISRGESGVGTIQILDTARTTESNGVTIEVPVKDHSEFNQRAKDFFRYWKPGTVLVDGTEPSITDGIWLTDDLLILEGIASDIIVMGGVPYPVRQNLPSGRLPYRHKVVAWVDMGKVEFVPSREDLLYTDHTNALLDRIRQDVLDGIVRVSEAEISNAKSAPEAARVFIRWKSFVGSRVPTWQGNKIPVNLRVEANHYESEGPPLFLYDSTAWRSAVSTPNYMDLEYITSVLQVTGFTNKAVSKNAREKLKKYCADNDIIMRRAIFTDKPVGAPWSDEVTFIDYADVLAVSLPKSVSGKQVAADGFRTYQDGQFEMRDSFPTDTEIIMVTSAWEIDASRVSHAYPEAMIVTLGKNRWDKFKRDNKSAIELGEKLQNEVDSTIIQWSFADALENVRAVGTYFASKLVFLRWDAVDDPELAKLVRDVSSKPDAALSLRLNTALRISRQTKETRWGNPTIQLRINHGFSFDSISVIQERYPLLEHLDRDNASDMAEYVNLMYGKDNK